MKEPPLTDQQKSCFDDLLDAAFHGNLALLQTRDAETKEPTAVVCVVNKPPLEGGKYEFVPLARLLKPESDPA